MSLETDIATLHEEVAALRKTADSLMRFITAYIDAENCGAVGMNIRCRIVTFVHPDVPNHTQACIGASQNGP